MYFDLNSIKSIDDLRSQYKDLAKQHHPDSTGRDTRADFQAMQAEYSELVNNFLTGGKFSRADVEKEIAVDEAYKAIINELAQYEDLNIEIIGTWIWISGDTYPIKDIIKKAGFKYAPVKRMWFLNTTGQKVRSTGIDIDKIRKKYGTTSIPTGRKKLNGIGAPKKRQKFNRMLKTLIKRLERAKSKK